MAATDHTIDEQVEDLRERMRLLQGDRRANIDILEANKAANKEEIRRLREDNKDLRVKIAQVQRSGAEGPRLPTILTTGPSTLIAPRRG